MPFHQNLASEMPRIHCAALILLFASLFALVSRGTLMSSDEGGIFNTASAITRGSLVVPAGENVDPGRDGRLYSLRETLPTIATVPFFVMGAMIDVIFRPGPPPLAAGPRNVGIELLDASNWPLFVTTTALGSMCGALTLFSVPGLGGIYDTAGNSACIAGRLDDSHCGIFEDNFSADL